MRIIYSAIIAILLPVFAQAQIPKSIIASGNWTDTAPWADNIPANVVQDDVTMAGSTSITVQGVDNITSGDLDAGNNNTLTIDPGGELQIGDNTHTKDITAGTSMTIVANDGVLIIWGDLVVNNSLAITIQGPSGAIVIKGNLIMADNASIVVNGNLEVDGNFTGGMNTNVTVGAGASISVYGSTSVGPGSNVIGSGHFNTFGGCSGPASFCSSLPVELIFFTAEPTLTSVKLNWATASELNFDYFIVEKSIDAKIFTEVVSVAGHGTSRVRNDYSAEDEKPTLGTTYYRLTEVDLDKSVHPLKIIEVNYSGLKSLSIYPNPVTEGRLTFELNFVPEGEVVVSIVDLRGVTLSEFAVTKPSLTLPLQLTTGIYIVMLRSNDFKSVSRLVVK